MSEDERLVELLTRLQMLDRKSIDAAMAVQREAEAKGRVAPLVRVLVHKGYVSYGQMERIRSHLAGTEMACRKCQYRVSAAELDPRAPFACPDCKDSLVAPEQDAALTSLESIIAEGGETLTRDAGLIGQTLAGCRIERKIGEGGMGAVYEAVHDFLQRKVAIKILPEYHVHQPGFVERFLRESRTAASIVHPNVVQVMDAGKAGEIYYIVMEFVEGKSLEGILKEEKRVPIPRALEFTRQAALGLGSAADKGIIHRDIKPDNIRITPLGEAKVADFGLAKGIEATVSQQVTATGAILGTPLYMSPEQARGEKVDFRSDIYSLGVTLYHLIAGQPPFKGASAISILQKHTQDPPPPLTEVVPDCPRPVNDLVLRMLAKAPEDRFASYADLATEIERVQRTLVDVEEEPRRKPRGLVAAIIVLVLIAGGIGSWALLGKGDTPPPIDPEPVAEQEPPEVISTPVLATATITSTPPGATVICDGEDLGPTPLDLEDLAPGEVVFEFHLEGYESQEVGAELKPGEETPVDVTLTRILASVRISSRPPGARVALGDEERGHTPTDLADLDPGEHDLRLELEGWEAYTQTITLVPGVNEEILIRLVPLPASVTISTEPPGAQIQMGGKVYGPTPVTVDDLVAGKEYTFEARMGGYEPEVWSQTLAPGENSVSVPLSRPEAVEAYLAEVARATSLLEEGFPLKAGAVMDRLADSQPPADLTRKDRDRAREVRVRLLGAPSARLTLEFDTLGSPTLEGQRALSAPAPMVRLGGRRRYLVEVETKSEEPLAVCVLRFSLNARKHRRLIPEGHGEAEALLEPEALPDSLEVKLFGPIETEAVLLIATSGSLSLRDIDDLKQRVVQGGAKEARDLGPEIVEKVDAYLETTGVDYTLEAAWFAEGGS